MSKNNKKNNQNQNNQNNAPAAAIQPREDGRFDGVHMTRLNENYAFGDEAVKYMKERFDYLERQGKLSLSRTKPHPHPYAAFCRKHFNQIIVQSLLRNSEIIDVGGHAMRTYVSMRKINGQESAWLNTVHSMLPVVNEQDSYRHRHWRTMLENMEIPAKWPITNSCSNLATNKGLCNCVNKATHDYISIDSAYYDGVIQGMEQEMLVNDRVGYMAFHDYAKPYREGLLEYKTFDGESSVQFDDEDPVVCSSVRGNPHVYRHQMVCTGSTDTWARQVSFHRNGKLELGFVLYNVESRLKQGAHDYVLVSMTPMYVKQIREIEVLMDYYEPVRINKSNDHSRVFLETVTQARNALKKSYSHLSVATTALIKKLASRRLETKNNKRLIVEIEKTEKTGEIVVVQELDQLDGTKCDKTYRVWPSEFTFAYKELMGKMTDSAYMTVYRRMLINRREKDDKDMMLTDCKDALMLAMYVTARDAFDVYEMSNFDEMIDKSRKAAKGNFESRTILSAITQILSKDMSTIMIAMGLLGLFVDVFIYGVWNLSWIFWFTLVGFGLCVRFKPKKLRDFIIDYLSEVIKVITVVLPVLFIFYFMNKIGVRAQQTGDNAVSVSDPTPIMSLLVIVLAAIRLKRNRMKPVLAMTETMNTQKWITSSCVRDNRRLDLKLNEGRYPAKWRFGAGYNIKGMSGDQAAAYLGCDKEGTILAGQVGPIFYGTDYYEPTIIHSCKKTIMAASIRACSNKIYPESDVMKEFEDFFENDIYKEVLESVEREGGIHISVSNWLKKYDLKYRQKFLNMIYLPDCLTGISYKYKSFPKIELQVTPVPYDQKETPLNNVKERQISGPSDAKKLLANSLINELEKMADKYIDGYCGCKNWPEICEWIWGKMCHMVDPVVGFSDGSGFDMTQIKRLQQLFTKLMKKLLASDLISFDDVLDGAKVEMAFENSEILKVVAADGNIIYEAEGRASGDGWTSYGNTILMRSYWKFIAKKAGLKKDEFHIMNKSDDVVLLCERARLGDLQKSIARYMSKENILDCFGLGQVTKFVKWGNLEDGDYLSNMFFMTERGPRMVRIPSRVFQTISWTDKIKPGLKHLDEISKNILFSKGSCLYAWGKGLPIFGVLAEKMMELGIEGPASDINKYVDPYRVWYDDDDYIACCGWMERKFGIFINEIEEVEDMIQKLDRFDTLQHPVFDKFLDPVP
jgi:hypothetical protein